MKDQEKMEFLGAIDAPPPPKTTGISGVSSVDHKKRVALQLTLDEYCVMLLIDQFANKSDIATYPTEKRCWEYLGMEYSYVRQIIGYLMGKVLLIPTKDGKLQVSPRWRKLIPREDEAFNQLYEKFRSKGNKASAMKHFKTVLNEMTQEQLFEKATNYMKYVHQNHIEWKYQLGLDSFLDPKTRKYDDHYQIAQDPVKRGKL